MIYRSDNSRFGTIKADLENKMMCGSDSYPKSKDKNVVLINSYHVSKQLAQTTPAKEEVAFIQTSSNTNVDTKTNKTNKKVESECFRYGDPNQWAYECPKLYEEDRYDLSRTK